MRPSTVPTAGGRPPVEHRVLGLDRRTFLLPLITVAVFLLWSVVAPAINGALDYDQPVEAGDAFYIAKDATMTPPVGWNVSAGTRVRDRVRAPLSETTPTAFDGDGVAVSTQAGRFAGDARALNAQVARTDETIAADRAFSVKGTLDTVTIDGRPWVARRFTTLTGEGAIFTSARDGEGISLVITGRPSALQAQAQKLGRMLASIHFAPAAR